MLLIRQRRTHSGRAVAVQQHSHTRPGRWADLRVSPRRCASTLLYFFSCIPFHTHTTQTTTTTGPHGPSTIHHVVGQATAIYHISRSLCTLSLDRSRRPRRQWPPLTRLLQRLLGCWRWWCRGLVCANARCGKGYGGAQEFLEREVSLSLRVAFCGAGIGPARDVCPASLDWYSLCTTRAGPQSLTSYILTTHHM